MDTEQNEVVQALKFSKDCRAMAKEVTDAVIARGFDRECASLVFLARATTAMESSEILVERGMNADATSVGRTITELDIDFAYILKAETEKRWGLYINYEVVSDWHDAQAWNALHDGKADPALMETARKKYDAVKADYPDEYKWAGKGISLKKRAEEVGKFNNCGMAYSSGCKASHSGAAGLRHIYDTEVDAAGNPTRITILVGRQTPDAHPVIIASVSYMGVLASTINNCGLQARFDARHDALWKRLMGI